MQDKDGKVSVEEMRQFLLKHSVFFQSQDNQQIVLEMDMDNDGFIDKKEVLHYIKNRLQKSIEKKLDKIAKKMLIMQKPQKK